MPKLGIMLVGLLVGFGGGYLAAHKGIDKRAPTDTGEHRETIRERTYEVDFKGSTLILTTERIEHLREVSQVVGAESIRVQPSLVTLGDSDLHAIRKALEEFEDVQPILNIKVLSPTKVEVRTGEVRGLLDGDGSTYDVNLIDGKWIAEHTGIWVS